MEAAGLAAIAVTVAAWSLAPVIVSRAAAKLGHIDPLAFNGWRMLIAAAATIPPAYIYERFPLKTPWLDPMFELGVWLGGVVATVLGDSLFVYSVSGVGASVAMPVSYLFVIWTGAYDYLRGVAGPQVLLAAVLAVAGVWIVSTSEGGRTGGSRNRRLAALAAAVATSLVWGGSMYAYQVALSRAGYLSVASARAVFTTLVLLPPMLSWRGAGRVAGEIVLSSLLGYVVGALAFLEALTLMPASLVALGIAMTPVASQALAAPLASERVERRLLLGGALVAAALAIAGMK